MIKKLDIMKDTRNVIDKDRIIHTVANFTAIEKINELVDAVNELQHDNSEKANCHENVQDKFAEQRKWIGCVCRFWFDNPNDTLLDYLDKIQTGKNGVEYYSKESGDWFPHCEPVLPTDNAIYKGDNNETLE